ncbi:MAG: glutathione S-transferase N-terminal domain-containing protein [Pseudomonadota bacterium]
MKLHFSPTSPYVRKVRAVAAEKGLTDKIELLTNSPWEENDLSAANPSGRVPALETDDGMALFDSRVICEYLDDLGGGESLFPKGENRWAVLRTAAIAEGIMDAGVSMANERRKDEQHWSDWFIGRQQAKIHRSLDTLEAEIDSLSGPINVAQIGTGVALGYIEFRNHVDDWRAGHPKLTTWYEEFSTRPSMAETAPKG